MVEKTVVVEQSALQEKVWCVRCKDAKSAGYRWAKVAFEVSRALLFFTKGLVNMGPRQHNRVQLA